MKKVSKLIFLFVVCAAALTMLTACGKPKLADENWRVDMDGHWHETVDGEKVDEEKHKLEEDHCTVCNSRIDFFEDGETWVTQYNDHEDMIAWITFAADGTVTEEVIYEYEYDKNGEYVSEREYDNGRLTFETFFTTVAGEEEGDEFTYAHESIFYREDGSKVVEGYDTNGDTVSEKTYDAAGNLVTDYTVKYTYDENGYMISLEKFDGDVLAESVIYDYNDELVQTGEKYYKGETLVKEYVFTVVDGWSYVSSVVEYHEDGTQTVTEYDEDDVIVG